MPKYSAEAEAIIADLKDRSGPIKVAEADDCIILDAEALIVCPEKD